MTENFPTEFFKLQSAPLRHLRNRIWLFQRLGGTVPLFQIFPLLLNFLLRVLLRMKCGVFRIFDPRGIFREFRISTVISYKYQHSREYLELSSYFRGYSSFHFLRFFFFLFTRFIVYLIWKYIYMIGNFYLLASITFYLGLLVKSQFTLLQNNLLLFMYCILCMYYFM